MIKPSHAWGVVLVTAVAVAAAPRLREQARLQWAMLPPVADLAKRSSELLDRDPVAAWLGPYLRRSGHFVERQCPDDPEMLLAAGLLASDRQAALAWLERAVRAGGGAVAQSAYADAVLEEVPRYERPGTLAVDPGRRADVSAIRREIRKRRIPTAILTRDSKRLISALDAWQESDPENALPRCAKAWCLYGLHRDFDASAEWRRAAALPKVTAYPSERADAVRKLLVRMGMPGPEAIVAATTTRAGPAVAVLGVSARVAWHEGRRAQLEGRAGDALRYWHATLSVGRHMQGSAESVAEFVAGADIESIGGWPAWCWYPNSFTGLPGRGIMGGRFLYGPQHAFYVTQAGEAADRAVRDSLLRAKARTMVLNRFTSAMESPQWYTRAAEILVFGQLTAGLLVAACSALALAMLPSPVARRALVNVRSHWLVLLPLPSLLVLAVAAGITVATARLCPVSPMRVPVASHLAAGIAVSALTALLLPLAAALMKRRPGVSRLAAWRQHLQRSLPTLVVILALLYIGLHLGATTLRARWVRQKTHPMSEMERARRASGARWENPWFPPDSWRAEYPPRR